MSAPELTVIGSEKAEPRIDVIEMARRLLSEAESGELRALAVVCAYSSGDTYADYTANPFGNQMMAAISDLQWRFSYARYCNTIKGNPPPLDPA